LNSVPRASGGSSTLIALFELIFVRLRPPRDSACVSITQATEEVSDHCGSSSASIPSAATCRASPPTSVTRSPKRDAIQPPSRLVTMPKNS